MKITKQTVYRNHVAQRAMGMEEIVAWVKDEQTREKLTLFRERLRRAYPDRRLFVYPGNYLSCSLPGLSGKAN